MQSPKQFSPVMQRALFGLLILRKAIFWEPWQNVFSGHENEAKNANFQVRKTYKFAKSKNGTRASFGNSKIILVEVQRWFFVTIKLIFKCSFNFEACMLLYMGLVSQFFTHKWAKMLQNTKLAVAMAICKIWIFKVHIYKFHPKPFSISQ